MKDWEKCHDEARAAAGLARPGADRRRLCTFKPLSAYAGLRMRPETRAKLEALARSGDPEASMIVQRALAGHSDSDYEE